MLAMKLYAKVLGVHEPWCITDIDVGQDTGEVRVFVEGRLDAEIPCPVCGHGLSRGHSHRQVWRLADPVEADTVLVVDVPGGVCPVHGEVQAEQPWAQAGSGFHPSGPD